MKKRFLSALLAMAMVLTMLPMSAFAAPTEADLTAGFEMEAAEAEKALGIVRDDDDSSTWCDPKTMYVLIKGVALNDKYALKVTHTKEDGSSEKVYEESQFTVAKASVDRGFSRVYFSFDRTAKPEGETHSTADIDLAAGVYTFTVTKDGANEPLVTTIELVEENGSFKVKEEEVIPPTKVELEVGYNPLAADAEGALGIDRETEPSSNWCDDMTMWVKVKGVAKDEVYNLSVTRPKDAATEDVIDADDYTITEAQATRGFARIYFTFDPTVKNDPDHSGAKVDIAAGEYTFTLKKGSDIIGTQKLTLVEDADSKGGFKVGTSEAQEYTITVAPATNGTVTTTPADKAVAGTEVTVNAAPAENYKLGSITVKDADNGDVTVTDGKFTMPASNVTVTATFVEDKEPAERTEKIASTGFEAKGADADKALGITNEDGAAAHCDPNTMWAKFEGLNAEKNYTLTVKKGDAVVYTETPFPGTATKVYFTLDPELVAKANANADDPAVKNHSVAKTAIAEGKYEFTLTEVKAQAPAGQAGETEEKPLEAKAELEICKVTFAAGEGASGAADPIFAALNGKITLPEAPTNAPSADYGFAGWGVAVAEDGKYIVTKSETLTALWKNNNVDSAPAESTVTGVEDSEAKGQLEADGALVANAAPLLNDDAALQEANDLADTLTAKKDEYLAEANKDITDDAEKFDGVKVIVYMQIDVTGYQAPEQGSQPKEASLKLNVTPKVAVVATKTNDQGKEETTIVSSTAKPVANTKKSVTIEVTLPTGFPTTDLYAKHYEGNGTTVKEWLDVIVDTGVAKFEASSFSPFELVQDSRKVTVTFKDSEGAPIAAIGNNGVQTLTPANIGEELPTVTVAEDEEFKGWAVEADKTKVVYNGKLTEEYLTKMSETATLDLFAVIGDKDNGGSTGPAPGGIGGGSGATTYSVNVPATEHGTVTVNPRNAAKDATVTITVAPNQGYHLDTLTVTDKDGNNIELTKVDSNKYTFKMPASRVEVKATFVEGEAPAVSFTDVTEGEYYYDAVLWAVDKGITTGLTETTFGPNASCTRAQMVTFLWRAAGSPEPAATTTAFTDIDANEYYYKAVLWAVEKGITTGATETTFAPNATVTRAQTVTFLYRYAGKPAVSGSNGFTDLEAGEYYVDAVQWAATNGITTGTTETTFSPANNCTRGQIVTFLYRHIVK